VRKERGPYRYRRLQLLEGYGDDPYRPARKPRGPVRCPRCGAVFRDGRWSWSGGEAPAGRPCPACRRIAEAAPAGILTLAGEFFRHHRAEILARLVHCAEMERAEHPLERVIAMNERGDGLTVTTTSPHLARLIGHAVKSAFKGRLRLAYSGKDNLLRVSWSRAA
jgi:hypothetical protein